MEGSFHLKYKDNFGLAFLNAVSYALKKCKCNFSPKFEQLQAIHELTIRKDVFVNLSTGFGKSLIYTLFPFVCDFILSTDDTTCTSSSLVLVSPLISLMDDQLSQMSSQGISAVKLTDLNSTQLNSRCT